MINFMRKKAPKKKNLLELPADKQKRIYKQAADKSVEMQMEVINRYEKSFGEKIERSH